MTKFNPCKKSIHQFIKIKDKNKARLKVYNKMILKFWKIKKILTKIIKENDTKV